VRLRPALPGLPLLPPECIVVAILLLDVNSFLNDKLASCVDKGGVL